MQIHQLSLPERKARKRIGRGGKRGTTSGRGSKGQKARSGASVDPLFEGGRSSFLERLKKVRGFKSIHKKKYTVSLGRLERAFQNGETVTLDLLIERKLVPKAAKKCGAKIVSAGSLQKKLSLGVDVSASGTAQESFGSLSKAV
jgi:large subunit ribosomal protein L15